MQGIEDCLSVDSVQRRLRCSKETARKRRYRAVAFVTPLLLQELVRMDPPLQFARVTP
jgi:hypothetical protein